MENNAFAVKRGWRHILWGYRPIGLLYNAPNYSFTQPYIITNSLSLFSLEAPVSTQLIHLSNSKTEGNREVL